MENEQPVKLEEYKQDPKKMYKYCCRRCKHPDRGKKFCLCVVPKTQRKAQLGDTGCQVCKCEGCSIEDYLSRGEDPEYKPK